MEVHEGVKEEMPRPPRSPIKRAAHLQPQAIDRSPTPPEGSNASSPESSIAGRRIPQDRTLDPFAFSEVAHLQQNDTVPGLIQSTGNSPLSSPLSTIHSLAAGSSPPLPPPPPPRSTFPQRVLRTIELEDLLPQRSTRGSAQSALAMTTTTTTESRLRRHNNIAQPSTRQSKRQRKHTNDENHKNDTVEDDNDEETDAEGNAPIKEIPPEQAKIIADQKAYFESIDAYEMEFESVDVSSQ